MPSLHVVAGPDAGRVHALPDGEPQLIGRSAEALGSSDPSMSRRHAELTPSGGVWHLRDLGSANGTLVNGQPVRDRRELRPGDEVRCGDTVMELRGAAAPPRAAVAGDPAHLQAIGETVATISHSVKNVLQGLRSGADAVELALRRGDLAMAREGWPIVARNLDRVSWLAMNMLAYAKERPLEVDDADLGQLVREAVDLMRSTAERQRVRLSAEVDDPMPPAPVDANAVHQVLLNLLANAVDAAPAGSGRVTVRCRLDGAAGRFVVEVDDDGPGIPAEQRPRLFEAFASTKGQRGTGLGLAVARSLVTRHGGDVEHEDLRPRGTRMRAWFPADRGDPDAERTRAPRPGEPPAVRWDPPER